MNNFLTFIEKDIATKKTQIQTLPIKTKTNIKKFNETIESFENKYVRKLDFLCTESKLR